LPYIGRTPLTGAYQLCDTITTSATATYNLLVGGSAVIPGSANNCIVSLNGVVQAPVSAFTVSGSTITFASTLSATDVIDFILILGNVFDIGTPTNGAVGTSQLATNLTVTHALGAVGTPSITFTGDTNTGIYSPTADTIAFTEGGTEAMRIDSSGQVGIGTSSPLAQLSVQTTAGSNTGFLRFNDITYGGQIRFGKNEGISNDAVLGTWGANNTLFFTDSTERMRIDSSGNVLFGISASIDSGDNGISLTTAGIVGLGRFGRSGTGSNTHIQFYNGNGNVGTITTSGSATAYNTSSDYRLKENVSYDFDATTRLKQLKPARFNFIASPNKTVDGFLAHEVQSVIPEAITGIKDETETKEKVVVNSNGRVIAQNIEQADWEAGKIPNEEGTSQYPIDSTWEASKVVPIYQGIDQSKLTPILTKALQEAIARIESLEARLTALENN
jgi:hypothetical protein